MSDPVKFKLTTPIQVVGEMRDELVLREPNGRMWMAAGACIRFIQSDDGPTTIEPVPAAMGKLLGLMAGVPLRAIEMMSARDLNNASIVVMNFLSPPVEETGSSTVTANAPAGGATLSLSSD